MAHLVKRTQPLLEEPPTLLEGGGCLLSLLPCMLLRTLLGLLVPSGLQHYCRTAARMLCPY